MDDEQHLAEMVAFMGPPPREFLQRRKKCATYFDESGKNIEGQAGSVMATFCF